jgi:hypothetical protein
MRPLILCAVLLAVPLPAAAQFTAPPACMDGVDNDDDGETDYSVTPGQGDPGCDAWNDTSEVDLNFSPAVKPRLAIIFDTSGSMIWNVCTTNDTGAGYTGGDGSLSCPGNDVPCCNTRRETRCSAPRAAATCTTSATRPPAATVSPTTPASTR